jgi:predicted phage tail protein|tara:strand:- start:3425 stop:4120 length:696 start_codon:yes stop_codon:yes gene_type:complete
MQRSVYLQGELGERFGHKFIVNTDNYADIFKCINANKPEWMPYVRKCHEENIAFIVETEDGLIDQDDLLTPIATGDVTISLVPAGSKKGIGKIILAIVMIYIMVQTGYVPAGETSWMMTASGGLTIPGSIAVGFTTSLAIQGIQQIMAPDPAVDQDAPSNYLFSGGANNSVEGDPIPIMYGELRVPGRPISVDIAQGGNAVQRGGTQVTINNVVPDSANNANIAQTQTQEN